MDKETKLIYNVLLGILSVIIAGIIIFVSYEIVSYKHQPKIYQMPAEANTPSTRSIPSPADKLQKSIQQREDETWIKIQEQIWKERAEHLKSMQDKESKGKQESGEKSNSKRGSSR